MEVLHTPIADLVFDEVPPARMMSTKKAGKYCELIVRLQGTQLKAKPAAEEPKKGNSVLRGDSVKMAVSVDRAILEAEAEVLIIFEANFQGCSSEERSFNSLCGVPSDTVGRVWHRYGAGLKMLPSFSLVHLLWALSFMKVYASWDVTALIWRETRSKVEMRSKAVISCLNGAMCEVCRAQFLSARF